MEIASGKKQQGQISKQSAAKEAAKPAKKATRPKL
jgi:hypothetical protein